MDGERGQRREGRDEERRARQCPDDDRGPDLTVIVVWVALGWICGGVCVGWEVRRLCIMNDTHPRQATHQHAHKP